MNVSFRSAGALLLVLALGAPASASGVRIVDALGGPSYPTIQQAIDAAADGDVLLVGSGTGYAGFTIDGKSIAIVSDPNGFTGCGPIRVENLAAHQRVVLAGLAVTATDYAAMWIENSAGEVRAQFCTFNGRPNPGNMTFCSSSPGSPAVRIDACDRVVFDHCVATGGDGASSFSLESGGGGGDAIRAFASRLALHACALRGGDGGDGYCRVGPGGSALRSTGGFTFAVDVFFEAGSAGPNQMAGTGACAGGSLSQSSGEVHHAACGFEGGASSGFNCPPNGGSGIGGGAVFTVYPITPTIAFARTVGEAGAQHPITVTGTPGHQVDLAISRGTAFLFVPGIASMHLVPVRALVSTTPLGVIPASGTLQAQALLPGIPAGATGEMLFLQPVVRGHGERRLGNALQVLALDRTAGSDCDGDGTNDLLGVLEGTAADANDNLVPDGCPGG